MSEEQRIIAQLQNREAAAITWIYDHYAPALYGILIKMMKSKSDAQDVLQESFIKIQKNGPSYDPKKSKLFTWLLRIVRNTAIDHMRSKERRLAHHSNSERIEHSSDRHDWIREDTLDLGDHIDRLEPKYAEVLRSLYYNGMSQSEASKSLEVPLGTIKTRLRFAISALRKLYVDEALFMVIIIELL